MPCHQSFIWIGEVVGYKTRNILLHYKTFSTLKNGLKNGYKSCLLQTQKINCATMDQSKQTGDIQNINHQIKQMSNTELFKGPVLDQNNLLI